MAEIEWWDEQPKLWEKLVPPSGQADTLQGELIRCTGKLADEAYRNGNMNWENGYEKLVRFVGDNLNDSTTFTRDELEAIARAVKKIIEDFDKPDTSGHGSPHYLLTEMAVRWCLAHPDPIPHRKNPNLRV